VVKIPTHYLHKWVVVVKFEHLVRRKRHVISKIGSWRHLNILSGVEKKIHYIIQGKVWY